MWLPLNVKCGGDTEVVDGVTVGLERGSGAVHPRRQFIGGRNKSAALVRQPGDRSASVSHPGAVHTGCRLARKVPVNQRAKFATGCVRSEGDLSERARQRAAELANDADVRLSPPKSKLAPPSPVQSTRLAPFVVLAVRQHAKSAMQNTAIMERTFSSCTSPRLGCVQ